MIIWLVCSFFTISYTRVFHRLKRNIFLRNSMVLKSAFKPDWKKNPLFRIPFKASPGNRKKNQYNRRGLKADIGFLLQRIVAGHLHPRLCFNKSGLNLGTTGHCT